MSECGRDQLGIQGDALQLGGHHEQQPVLGVLLQPLGDGEARVGNALGLAAVIGCSGPSTAKKTPPEATPTAPTAPSAPSATTEAEKNAKVMLGIDVLEADEELEPPPSSLLVDLVPYPPVVYQPLPFKMKLP